MEHSTKFELVKGYYKKKLWNKKRVHDAVGRWITDNEYKEITGDDFK